MKEHEWDKMLQIRTSGRDDSHAGAFCYPYEPTPYCVLERLVQCGYISKKSKVIDYGCGKGRVGFFLNYMIGCKVIGIEYDERIYRQAVQNRDGYVKCSKPEFFCIRAEEYVVEDADCFYFFNPFSVEILKTVIRQILDSYYRNPRKLYFFFYYPQDEYLSCLMTADELMFCDEIDCRDLFGGKNDRERIMIFQMDVMERAR